jgi:hypothetical protein
VERLVTFYSNGTPNQVDSPQVGGTYAPEVGDYDGNAYDDIAWVANGTATLWKFDVGTYTQQKVTTTTKNTNPATITNYRYPA